MIEIGAVNSTLNSQQVYNALVAKKGTTLKQYGNSYVFEVGDFLVFRGDVDLSGFTFIFQNGKTFYAEQSNFKAGKTVGGKHFDPLRIIYTWSTGMHEHQYNINTKGLFRNSTVDIKQLHISIYQRGGGYHGVTFANSKKTVIEELVIDNLNPSGKVYANFNLTHTESEVKIYQLHGSTLRNPAGKISFIPTGKGWYRGEEGNENIKLLTKTGTEIKGFSFVSSSSSIIQMSSDTITGASELTFLDSFISNPNNQIGVYPPNRDDVVRNISRTINIKATNNSNHLSGLRFLVYSDRVKTEEDNITGGINKLHDSNKNSGDSEVIRVWRGRNTINNSAYALTKKRIDDSNLTVILLNYNYERYTQKNTGYTGSLLVDAKLKNDTSITEKNINTVQSYPSLDTASKIYDYCKLWFVTNYEYGDDLLCNKNGNTIDFGSLNVVFNSLQEGAILQVSRNTTTGKIEKLTIKGDNIAADLITTGLIQVQNGTISNNIKGTVIDSTQDSFLRERNGGKFSVFDTINKRDTNSNALASSVTQYPFLQANTSAKLYISAIFGDTRLPFDIEVQKGSNEFDAGIAGQLQNLALKINAVQATTSLINRNNPPNQ